MPAMEGLPPCSIRVVIRPWVNPEPSRRWPGLVTLCAAAAAAAAAGGGGGTAGTGIEDTKMISMSHQCS